MRRPRERDRARNLPGFIQTPDPVPRYGFVHRIFTIGIAMKSDVAQDLTDSSKLRDTDVDTNSGKRHDAANKREVSRENRDAKSGAKAESLPEASIHQRSATDRKRSSEDRHLAEGNGEDGSDKRDDAAMDHLTGAYLRGPGIVELQREMERAVRTTSPLLVAFIDVNSLKAVNDSRGRGAGDRVLISVVETIAERLRPYDRIVRYSGDEFVCILPDISEADAARRFAKVNACLSWGPDPSSISFGVAMMVAGDSVATLVGKADRERCRNRIRK